MTRIECETAAQCQRFAEATHDIIDPSITIMVVGMVLVAAATVIYREREQ